jgi:ABC-2 type transport system permease protein
VAELLGAYFDVYRAQLKATIALQLQYRVSAIIWLAYTVLEPVIYLVVWSAVARSTGGRVGGYSTGDFAAYYLAMMWVNQLTFTWIMHEFEFRIRQGQFSPKLLRPIHPIHSDIADNLGYKVITVVVLIPATAVLILAFQPTLVAGPRELGLFILALLFAFAVRFLFGWALALGAFWTTRVSALNATYFMAMVFLSGQMAPLALMPRAVQIAASILPFRWMAAFPVEVLLGRATGVDLLTGFAAQIGWTIVCLMIVRVVWSAALRRYTAVGA